MYVFSNPNPKKLLTGDCVVRAIALATGKSWGEVYVDVCLQGFAGCEMPSDNTIWHTYLMENGYKRHIIPDTCPNCYTIGDFCYDNPIGIFILATGTHVVAVIDGDYFDTWDSGNEIPIFYFAKE